MRSSVRARAVLPLVATISVLVAPECVAHADEAAPSSSAGSNSETADERFRRFKAEGDRALAEKRLHDAIKAYDAAVAIRRDPLVAGRLGLALSFLDNANALNDAAVFLHVAIEDVAGVSAQENDAFWAAYKRVRKSLCRLEIVTNDANVLIDLGGGMIPRPTAFFTFVKKGHGQAVGRLDGRAEIRKTWDCKGDQDIELRFDFPPAATDSPKTITVVAPAKETVKIVHVPISAVNSIAKPDSKGNRLGVLFGPSVVFGVAPSPAWGLSLSSTYKFKRWSAMLGARAAYAFGPIEGNRIDVLAVTGLAGPCTTAQWFYVCGFAAVNVIKSIPDFVVRNDFDTSAQVVPGLGIGMGVHYSLTPAIALYTIGDAMILSSDVTLAILKATGDRPIWTGRQGLLSLSLGVSFGR